MANNHGQGASLPRPHRPRAPIMTASPPITAHLAPLWPASPVSLIQPRPECDRITNEYVETPFRPGQQQQPQPPPPPPTPPPPPILTVVSSSRGGIRPPPPRLPPLPSSIQVVTKQPKKPTALLLHHHHLDAPAQLNIVASAAGGSIVCPECGRCRCHSCQQPRRLPHKWLCNNFCLCSADAIIDYATCLCCVKAFMYHCCYEADNEEDSCPDDPCSCAPDDLRTGRWTCLATMAFCLPCLWLYWPLQCGKRAVEACYARHSRQGCRCRNAHAPTNAAGAPSANPALSATNTLTTTPEKRLLDSSPEF